MEELSAFGISVAANEAMGIESVFAAAAQMLISRALCTAYVHLQCALTVVCTVI